MQTIIYTKPIPQKCNLCDWAIITMFSEGPLKPQAVRAFRLTYAVMCSGCAPYSAAPEALEYTLRHDGIFVSLLN